jgi:hypothetical protein
MKKPIFIAVLVWLVTGATQWAGAQSLFAKWPELGAFHGVMSQTFHPSEEGNLEPIKTRSGEMVEKALALSKSDIPADEDSKAIRSAVRRLKKGSKALHRLVAAKAPDAEITRSLAGLHDVFHEIVGLCVDEKH